MIQKISIFRELLFAFVLVVLVPALIISVVSAWSSYQIGQQRTLDQLDSVITLKSAEIDMWTNELIAGLDVLVSEDELSDIILPLLQEQVSPSDTKQAHDMLIANLKQIVAKNQLFTQVCLLDVNGRVIASTDSRREGLDLSATSYYQQGLQKDFISPPFRDTLQDQSMLIVVVHPIVAPGQGAVGVLAGYSDISVLERIMKEPTGLGKTGESYLVGADYTPLTQLRFQTDSTIPQVNSDGIRLAIENRVGGHGMYRDYQGNPVIGAYTWLPILQVALVIEQDQQEAFSSTFTTLGINLVVASVSVLLTVLIAFLVTRSIATPLTILSTTATEIAAGNLEHVADVNRQDEIGTLAQAFNHMTGRLRNLIQELQAELKERKKAEENLRMEHIKALRYFDNAAVITVVLNKQAEIVQLNHKGYEILEYGEGELIGRNWFRTCLRPHDYEQVQQVFDKLIAGQKDSVESYENVTITKSGKEKLIRWHNSFVQDANGDIIGILSSGEDVTERKRAEDELKNQKELLQKIVDNIPVMIAYIDPTGQTQWVNRFWERVLGWSLEEATGRDILYEMYPDPQYRQNVLNLALTGDGTWGDFRTHVKDGRVIDTSWANVILSDGTSIGIGQDITERKQAEQLVKLQLKRLRALNEIDRAIASSLDMRLSLDILLSEVLSQLSVDAASVLLLDGYSHSLEFVAGKGFHLSQIRHSRMRLGDGLAGRVGLERESLRIPNLDEAASQFKRAELLKEEKFVEYFGVPLVAKGQLKGVLEIFHRAHLYPDQEWVNYLETIGGQAAIAIDNAQLFEGVQHSNLELIAAYDATIAGWSQAMDLRDKETEGHTLRVTELTLKLTEKMGISQREQVHVRRGALLHDIGKLGVPDQILLKTGKLTDEEWVIMRQHPVYAFNMLMPIHYLRPALDIPYCHHEKWDGSGYPRGLKGEQIPLVARIFAVVDVWDALRSDRPYRASWSVEKTRAYILEQSGKHFDPKVVQAFLPLIEDE